MGELQRRCTRLACEDGRNPLTESVASLNMSFSGLELPKWPSFRQLPLATVRWVWRSNLFCVQKRPSANQNARHPSFLCLTPGSSVTRDISPQIMKTAKTPLDIGYRYNGQACHLANHHDLFNLPQDFRQPARASFKAPCQTTTPRRPQLDIWTPFCPLDG